MSTQQKPEQTAVARTDAPKGIIGILEHDKARSMITPLLPDGVTYERIAREVYFAGQKNPEILKATVPSLIAAVAEAVQMGGRIGEDVHLVPFNTNVAPQGQPKQWETRITAIRDYKFKAQLIVATGAARSLMARCVYANEHYVHQDGVVQVFEHHPIMDEAQRGPMVGAYALARLRFGEILVEPMSLGEIEKIRTKSKQWSQAKVGACPDWYAKKTCINRIAKLLPKNERLAKLLGQFAREDEREAVLDDGPVAEIAAPTVRTLSRGTPLPALGTPGASGQAMAGYPGAADAPERITTRAVEDDVYAGDLELASEDEAER